MMKSIKIVSLVLFILVLAVSNLAASSTERFNLSPNAEFRGMGGIASYGVGSVWHTYQNQAGLSMLQEGKAISLSYQRLYNLFDDFSLAGGFGTFFNGYIGFGFSFLNYGKQPNVSGVNNLGLPAESENNFYNYQFSVLMAYSQEFKKIGLYLGGALKFMQQTVAVRREVYGAVDLSALYFFKAGLGLGLNLRNLGFNMVGDSVTPPLQVALGLSVPSHLLKSYKNDKLQFEGIAELRLDSLNEEADHLKGLVRNMHGLLGFRALINDSIKLSTGVRIADNGQVIRPPSLGIGYLLKDMLSFDYAFNKYTGVLGASHTVTVTYSGGVSGNPLALPGNNEKVKEINIGQQRFNRNINSALSFENVSRWKGTLTPDREHVKDKRRSGKWEDVIGNYRIYTYDIPSDWTPYDGITISIYSAKKTTARLAIGIYSVNEKTDGTDYWDGDFAIDWEGWGEVRIPFAALEAKREPKGYHDIERLMFSFGSMGGAPHYDTLVYMDNIQFYKNEELVDKDGVTVGMETDAPPKIVVTVEGGKIDDSAGEDDDDWWDDE